MFWIVDLSILIILLLCVFLGYKRGLAKCVIKILSFVIALIVAFVFFKPVAKLIIDNTEIDDGIRNSITSVIQKDVEEGGEVKEDSNLPTSMIEHINKEIKENVENTKETVVNSVANEVSVTAVNVISWIGLFIATRLVLWIISLFTSALTELPILKQIDKIGGIVYGVLESALIVFIVFAIISFISPMIENTGLVKTINKSPVGSVLYNNNPIMRIIL